MIRRVKIGNRKYIRLDKGQLVRAEPKPLSKRRRRILGMGRITPNQQRQRAIRKAEGTA